jgi:hypothetical protein
MLRADRIRTYLRFKKSYGNENVFATDIKQPQADILESGPFNNLDVLDYNNLLHFAVRFKITQVYNLAAVLSGNAEKYRSRPGTSICAH